MPEVLMGTERSEIACPKDSPTGVAPPGPANAHHFAQSTRRSSSSASCAISGSGKRGCACIAAPTRRAKRSSTVAQRPPSPTTTPNRSWRSPPPERSGSAKCAFRTPCSAAPSPPAGGLRASPATRKSPCLTSGPHSCHSAPMETHAFGFTLRANAPELQKRFPISWQVPRPTLFNCVKDAN